MTENTKMGREPHSKIVIDQDTCALTWKVLPCEAEGEFPCFNTRSTCQDPENYDKDVLPLKFVDPRSPQLRDDYYLPSLQSVKISAAKINPGGAAKSTSPFGKRATLTAVFKDHPHDDKLVDQYRDQRTYDPLERGTFWTKWRARNQFYLKRPITFTSSYFSDGALVDGIDREFVITKFSGPNSSGIVVIQGSDVLSLAEEQKAQAPIQNSGVLGVAINDTTTNVILSPSGIGDEEYSASGFIRINKEIMSYTRVSDTLTTSRGQEGTTADSHDQGDNIQECTKYTSENLADILYDLLLNNANIPASFLDKTQWDDEVASFQTSLYTAIISEPTGISKLVSEMCEQMYFSVYYDERVSLVKIRILRTSQGEEITNLTDRDNLVENSIVWTDQPDKLLTRVWVYYGQNDPTEKLEEASNYAAAEVNVSLDSESETQNNTKKIRKIFSRWIDASNTTAAADLSERLLQFYSNIPRQVSFSLDAKDRDLWLADFAKISNRNRVDAEGDVEPANIQIIQANESELGSKYLYVADEYVPRTIESDPDDVEIIIGADLLNVNLRSLYESLKGVPVGTENIIFIVRPGVTIGGDTAGREAGDPDNTGAASRTTTDDFYSGGTTQISGYDVGDIQIVQRSGIGSVTITAKNALHSSGNTADWIIQEYPLTTALTVGSWPVGVTLTLDIASTAIISGESGNGSFHGFTDSVSGDLRESLDGGDGGHAIDASGYPIDIINGGAIIGGGGGGGSVVESDVSEQIIVGGGSGGGIKNGDVSNTVLVLADPSGSSKGDPSSGDNSNGGSGGNAAYLRPGAIIQVNLKSGSGRCYGGNSAQNGEDGTWVSLGGSTFSVGGGGVGGDAVVSGSSNITWIVKGTVIGDEN